MPHRSSAGAAAAASSLSAAVRWEARGPGSQGCLHTAPVSEANRWRQPESCVPLQCSGRIVRFSAGSLELEISRSRVEHAHGDAASCLSAQDASLRLYRRLSAPSLSMRAYESQSIPLTISTTLSASASARTRGTTRTANRATSTEEQQQKKNRRRQLRSIRGAGCEHRLGAGALVLALSPCGSGAACWLQCGVTRGRALPAGAGLRKAPAPLRACRTALWGRCDALCVISSVARETLAGRGGRPAAAAGAACAAGTSAQMRCQNAQRDGPTTTGGRTTAHGSNTSAGAPPGVPRWLWLWLWTGAQLPGSPEPGALNGTDWCGKSEGQAIGSVSTTGALSSGRKSANGGSQPPAAVRTCPLRRGSRNAAVRPAAHQSALGGPDTPVGSRGVERRARVAAAMGFEDRRRCWSRKGITQPGQRQQEKGR